MLLSEPTSEGSCRCRTESPRWKARSPISPQAKSEQPVRTSQLGDHEVFGVMPAYHVRRTSYRLQDGHGFHDNAAKGFAVALGDHFCSFSPQTGALEAILDGRFITEARTAAVSRCLGEASGSRKIQISPNRQRSQAHSHFEALGCVRAFQKLSVWSPRSAAASRG